MLAALGKTAAHADYKFAEELNSRGEPFIDFTGKKNARKA